MQYAASNAAGTTTSAVPLQVVVPPTPATVPTSGTISTGQPFTVPGATYTSNGPIASLTATIQALIDGVWTPITVPIGPGGTFSPLDLAAVAANPDAQFKIQYNATNSAGSTLTDVPLTIVGPPKVAATPSSATLITTQSFVVPSANFTANGPVTQTVRTFPCLLVMIYARPN